MKLVSQLICLVHSTNEAIWSYGNDTIVQLFRQQFDWCNGKPTRIKLSFIHIWRVKKH